MGVFVLPIPLEVVHDGHPTVVGCRREPVDVRSDSPSPGSTGSPRSKNLTVGSTTDVLLVGTGSLLSTFLG